MKKLVQILQIESCEPLLVMQFVFSELTTAFFDNECTVITVKDAASVQNGGIAFVDNSNLHKNISTYEEIGKRCPDTIFVVWYWLDETIKPFLKMLYTGENWLKKPKKENLVQIYDNYMQKENYVPLLLRASEEPNKIGTYLRNDMREYCYMGAPYKPDWIPLLYSGIYHVGHWDKYLSYNERRAIYLTSIFALAFQSDDNIETGHFSQRIFEGLAYGCIVLCENEFASRYTDNIVVYVSSKEDLCQKMDFYLRNPEERVQKQVAGYEWVKKYGTNRFAKSKILEKIESLFSERFDKIEASE